MEELQCKFAEQIEELVKSTNRLAKIGFVTSQGGNLSLRVNPDTLLITPTKVAKADVRFEDVCIIDIAGNVLYANQNRKPTGEWPFHVHIMRKRPDVVGIIHAHPPVLTGFAIAGGDFMQRAFLPEAVTEVGPMLVVPYAVPLSDQLAKNFDSVICKSNGFLMENHGVVMVSPESLKRCLELLEMMESQGKSIIVAKILGTLNSLDRECVNELDNGVIKVRNLRMPGLPGSVAQLSDIFMF